MDFLAFFTKHREEQIISAVLEEDIHRVLKVIDKDGNLEGGRIFCELCGNVISVENLQMIIPKGKKEYSWICNDPKCVEKIAETIQTL